MRTIKIRNNTSSEKTWFKLFSANEEFTLPDNNYALAIKYATNSDLLAAIGTGDASIGNADIYLTTVADQIAWLRGDYFEVSAQVVSQTPFAEPLYRTKMDATSYSINIVPGESAIIDFKMTEEKYVSGGRLIIIGAEFGDYISAEVYDVDGVIPVAYRTALCENHPTVAKYVIKMFIDPNHPNIIDTKPLNAKITANLYLRVTYTAVNSGITRQLALNYDLTKKL